MTTPTVPYQTAKLKLDVDPFDTTAIFPQDPNWQKVDAAAGVITITAGNEPADSAKYDGMVIYESDTGKMYWYDSSYAGGGYWQKRYIDYPWAYYATSTANQNGNTFVGWNTFVASNSLNSTFANDSGAGSAVKVPLKGLYQGYINCRWDTNSNGERSATMCINGTLQFDTESRLFTYANSYPICLQLPLNKMLLNQGDLITVYAQNPGPSIKLYSVVNLILLRPLP